MKRRSIVPEVSQVRLIVLVAACTAATGLLGSGQAGAADDWPQWGGPHRNFISDATGLADKWPADGPEVLWKREVGDGYSGVSVVDGVLYTAYRSGDEDVTIALDAKTGETVWESKYSAPFGDEVDTEYGPGPHATPLIVEDRVYTVGRMGHLHCLDRGTGTSIWSHNLFEGFEGTRLDYGYASSPLRYKETLLVLVGGEGHSVVAFKLDDGREVWRKHDFANAYSSPILINVDGQDQLVIFMAGEAAGLDPTTGEMYWSHPHETPYGTNISTPVWGDGNLLFLSSAYGMGSRMLKLSQADGKTTVEELWYNKKVRIHHGNAVRVGDLIYCSSGDFGPAFLTAVNAKTGEIAWRKRGLPKATLVYADGKLIILDADGKLTLAVVSGDKLKRRSSAQVAKRIAWTAPTLAGTTLYVRDRKTITALNVGEPPA